MPRRQGRRLLKRIEAKGSLGISFAQGLVGMEDQNRVSRVYGRFLHTSTEQTGTTVGGSVGLTPSSMDSRLLDMSDDWIHFRFVDVLARAVVITPNSAEVAASMSWLPIGIAFEPITSGLTSPVKADLEHFPSFAIGSPFQLPCLHLTRKDLLGSAPVKWFATDTGGTELQLENQGSLFFDWLVGTGGSSGSLGLLIEYECEFKTPCDPNIVGERRLRRYARARGLNLPGEEAKDTAVSGPVVAGGRQDTSKLESEYVEIPAGVMSGNAVMTSGRERELSRSRGPWVASRRSPQAPPSSSA